LHLTSAYAQGDSKCGSGKCDISKIAGVENEGVDISGGKSRSI